MYKIQIRFLETFKSSVLQPQVARALVLLQQYTKLRIFWSNYKSKISL